MKRLFLYILTATLSIVGTYASQAPQNLEQSDTPWSYTISTPNGGKISVNQENGILITQNYASTNLYTLEEETQGIRFTVVETNKSGSTVNGFCYFVIGEFIVLDADGNHIAYTATSNCDHNEFNSKDGDGLPALNDGVLNNYFHSNYSWNAPDAYHYIELTFEKPIKEFSLEWYGRPNQSQYDFSPALSGITPIGYEFTEDMIKIDDPIGDDDIDDDDDDIDCCGDCDRCKYLN